MPEPSPKPDRPKTREDFGFGSPRANKIAFAVFLFVAFTLVAGAAGVIFVVNFK